MKALIVVNVAGFLHFLWDHIKLLQNLGYDVDIAANGKMSDGSDAVELLRLKELSVDFYQVDFDSQNPFSPMNINAYRQMKEVLKNGYAVVHCHTPIAGFITKLAANPYRKRGMKILYTTHGFAFTDRSSPKTWVVFYSLEKFSSRFCDAIITINYEDYGNAKKMHCRNVFIVSGMGLNTAKFVNVDVDRNAYRGQFGVGAEDKMILAVGQLTERKNHQIVLRALGQMKNKERYIFVIFGAGVSAVADKLEELARTLNVRLVLAGHRKDIPEAYQCADVVVLPSKREGLGMAGLEALASGTPVVGSDVQGIREYIVNGKTGYLCDPDNSEQFAAAIKKVINLSIEQRKAMADQCRKMAEKFDISVSCEQMEEIYSKILL